MRPGASGGPGGAPLCPAGTPGRSEDVRGADRAGPRGEHRSGPGEPARPRGEPGRAPGGGRPRSAVRPAPAGPQRAPRARAASPRPAGRPRGGRGEGKILLPGGRRTATQRPPRGVCLGGEKKSGAGGGGAGAVGAAGRPAAPRASSRLFPGFFQAAFFQEGFSRFFSRQLFPESFFQAADGWESPSIVVGGGWGTLGSSKGGWRSHAPTMPLEDDFPPPLRLSRPGGGKKAWEKSRRAPGEAWEEARRAPGEAWEEARRSLGGRGGPGGGGRGGGGGGGRARGRGGRRREE